MPKPDAGERRKQKPPFNQSFEKLGFHVSFLAHDNNLAVERKRPAAISPGVLIVLVGFIFVWATAVQSRDMRRTTNEAVVLFVLGLVPVFNGAAVQSQDVPRHGRLLGSEPFTPAFVCFCRT